jgi:hypothetical protein
MCHITVQPHRQTKRFENNHHQYVTQKESICGDMARFRRD